MDLPRDPLPPFVLTIALVLAGPGLATPGARAAAPDSLRAEGGELVPTGLDLRPDEGASADAKLELAPDPKVQPPSPAWEDSTPLARVGTDVITAGDFHYALDHGRGIDLSLPPAELKASTLDKIINQRLLVQEAYRRGYDRAGPLVNHVTQLEEQVGAEELRRRIYAGKLDVTESELRELYERYYYTLHVLHLSVEQRDLAEELRTRILAGEDFGELARRYSEDQLTAKKGGDMGEVRAGRMIIHYEDAVFPLEPGTLTPVIKGKGEHYKLFQLLSKERNLTPQRSFEEMAPDLAKRVRTRKAGDALYAWQKSIMAKYETAINEPNFEVFAHRLRDKIASWEAINAIRHDSLSTNWIFLDWPAEELALDLVTFKGGRLSVAEFTKISRQMQTCPTCLWRDSDTQLRQFVLGHAFDKLYALEKREIRRERVPALELLVERRKENRLAAMVGATLTVTADSVTADQARAFWTAHQSEYMTGEQARVRRIVVETEAEALDIMDRLAGGADFAALAKSYSKDETTNWRGGETDFFLAGSMYGMADVALQHEPGTLIPPFQSRLGWEVVQVIEKTPSTPKPFAEVQNHVKTRVATEETARRVDAMIADLRKKVPVEIDTKALARLELPS